MTSNKQTIEDIVRAVRIEPSRKLIYRDNEVNMFGHDMPNTISVDMLAENLQQSIYDDYIRGDLKLINVTGSPNANFIEDLKIANKTTEKWDTAWAVNSIDSKGAYHVKKGNYSRHAYPGEFIKESFFHSTAKEGERLRLLARKDFYSEGDPFYFVFGSTIGEDHQLFQFRFYFNVAYSGVAKLVTALTSSFNDFSIPFQFKCMALADGYHRCDTAVMYLDKRYFEIAARIIRSFYPGIENVLRAGCPLFTRPIAPGWSFAESPPNPNESFGSNRAKLIAKAIVDCFSSGIDPLLWPGEVVTRIENGGQSIEHFHLNTESRFPYNFDFNE